jgi:hypothetical protein
MYGIGLGACWANIAEANNPANNRNIIVRRDTAAPLSGPLELFIASSAT